MGYLIGIDIGGTNLRAAIISKYGDVIEHFKTENEVSKGACYNLDKLVNHIKTVWKDFDIDKVGVGAPGPLNLKIGKIINPPNLKGWENFNVAEYLNKKLNKPVKVNNDANVAGLAENLFGSAKGYISSFYVTVSTGVGGALIMNGKIVNGAHDQAGEIHNMIINEDKYSHSDLNKGGLESQCSGINIARIASNIYGSTLTTKEVFDYYKNNDRKAVSIIDNWIENISIGIANVITVVDPEIIVIGGAVLIYNTYLLPKIIKCVKTKVSNSEIVNIRIAKMGDDAGLIGAAML